MNFSKLFLSDFAKIITWGKSDVEDLFYKRAHITNYRIRNENLQNQEDLAMHEKFPSEL